MTKPTFNAVPEDIARMARAAPGGSEVVPGPATSVKHTEPKEEAVATGFRLPVKEATQTMSVKVPKSFYDDLRNLSKLTDVPMTEVLVEGGKRELARLKAKYGLEG